MLYVMTTSITFLVIGHILLSIGILGYFTNNYYLAYICVTLSLIFFIRQLTLIHKPKPTETTEPSTITN